MVEVTEATTTLAMEIMSTLDSRAAAALEKCPTCDLDVGVCGDSGRPEWLRRD